MASSTLIVDYLGVGLAADLPVAPNLPTGGTGFYYETDTPALKVWDSSAWTVVGAGSTTLAALTDCNIASLANDDFLQYQTSDSKWHNRTKAQATAALNAMVGDTGTGGTKGMVPAPGAGDTAAGKFLKASGAWAVPPDTGMTALTGDVTATGSGSQATTIAGHAVTNAKLAQMAAHTIKGNNTGSTADALDLTVTQVTAELNAVVGDSGSGGTKGLVPAPGAGDAAAGKFLKADGTFAVPTAGSGTVTHTGGALTVHAPIVGAGTDDEKALAAMTDGQLMIGHTGADPDLATLTAGTGITITPAAGSITVAATNTNAGTVTHTGGALTNHAPVVGAGGADEKTLAAMTNGQLLIGHTGADPDLATLTAGTNITITNAAGGITIDAATGATTFAGDTDVSLASLANNDFAEYQTSDSKWHNRTVTQATAALDAVVGDSGSGGTKGLVPAPASGDAAAGKFLKASGAWAVPPDTDTGITQLTSDVTAGPGSGSQAATIAANAVTNAKAAQMAQHTFKGNNTGSTANALDLTATQLTAELNAVVGDTGSGGTKGMVPAPGAGDAAAGKFLKADGTWTAPSAGAGTVTHTGGALTNHAPVVGAGTDDEKTLAAMTNGQLMIGNTGNDPTLATLTAGPLATITNGAGTITVDAIPGVNAYPALNLTLAAGYTEIIPRKYSVPVNVKISLGLQSYLRIA